MASNTSAKDVKDEEPVPSTWPDALHRFFIGETGPPLVIISILGFVITRLQLQTPFSTEEGCLFIATVVFWWVQEYVLHRAVLHSSVDWMGESIHQEHHDKHYFHVAIDSPAMLLTWLATAHLVLKLLLPWQLCLTATVAYAIAGLVYEFSHYIVHTKVKAPTKSQINNMPPCLRPVLYLISELFTQMKNNHVRHHCVDSRYWYAFSVPAMDDFFYTNPDVKDVQGRRRKEKMANHKKV